MAGRRPWYQVATPEQRRNLEAENWRRQVEASLFRGAHTEGTETASEIIARASKVFRKNPLGPKDEGEFSDPLAPPEVQVAADRERAGLPAPGTKRPGVPRGVAEAFPEEAAGRRVYDSSTSGPGDIARGLGGLAADLNEPVVSPKDAPGPARMLVEELTRPTNALFALRGPATAARGIPLVGKAAGALLEPGAGGFARRLITQAGAGAGARTAAEETAERLPEDTNPAVGFAARLVSGLAGGVAGGAAGGALAAKGPRAATRYRDVTRDIPVGASVKNVSGALPEDLSGGGAPSFKDALAGLRNAVRTEAKLRNTGVADAEVRAGRAGQFGGIRGAIEQGIERGLSGEALARQARSGASVPGGLRRTVAEPVPLTQEQRDALFDEVMTRLADPKTDGGAYLTATRALQKALDGEGLQRHEIRALQPMLGDDIMTALVDRAPKPPRESSATTPRGAFGSGPQLGTKPSLSASQPRKANDPLRNPRAAEEFQRGIRTEIKSAERDALKRFGPTEDALMGRARELLSAEERVSPLPGAKPIKGMKPEIEATIEQWLRGNRDILDNMGPEGSQLIANINAQITGNVADSYLSAALSRRNILAESLRASWGDLPDAVKATERDRIITKATDALFQRELKVRYGNEVPERVKELLKTTRPLPYDESLGALSTFSQRAKNSMFGLLDVGVFGVQGLSAVRRGGIPMFAALVNKGLAAMHMPNVATTYADVALPKQIQYALDGVKQGAASGAFARKQGKQEVGSLFSYLGKPGRAIDRPYMAAADKMSQWQFGTVLGGLRNAAYEGNLVIAHITKRDITNAAVRRDAARNANAIGSWAENALRQSRAQKEGVVFTSAPMTRARVAQIVEVAKVLGPKSSPTERILGATMILSSVGYTLAAGKLVNDYVGIGDFEFDPSVPGFGQITTAGGRIIDVIPQDSVERAFAKSIRAIMEADPELATKAWANVFIGSAGPIPRQAMQAAGVGYEQGRGYRYGDMNRKGPFNILNLAPLPPLFSSLLHEGFDPLGTTLAEVGVSSFPESGITKASRLFKEQTGIEFKDATAAQKRDFYGRNPRVSERLDKETLKAAQGGDREAAARAVGVETRQRLADLAKSSKSLADYREQRAKVVDEQRGKLGAYQDVIDGWKQSDNEIERLTAGYYDLFDQAKGPGGVLDFRVFSELEAKYVQSLGDKWEDVRANIGSIDPRDNPMEQQLDKTRNALAASGFFDQRDQAWESMRSRFKGKVRAEAAQFGDFYSYKDELVAQLTERLVGRGYDQDIARQRAEQVIQGHKVIKRYEDIMRATRAKWAKANPALAQDAIKAGYLSASELNLKASGSIPTVPRTPVR